MTSGQPLHRFNTHSYPCVHQHERTRTIIFQEQKDIKAKERKRQEAMQPKHQPTPIPEEGGDERRVS